jgi:hypothetical protein
MSRLPSFTTSTNGLAAASEPKIKRAVARFEKVGQLVHRADGSPSELTARARQKARVR